jgi:hypothetical protein
MRHVVSVKDPYSRILGFIDRSRYVSFCTHEVPDPLSENVVVPGIEPGPLNL